MNVWSYLQPMVGYINDPTGSYAQSMYGRWDVPAANMEGGVDLASPGGTPVYALATGPIVGVGNFWHGGGSCLYQGGAGCTPGYGVVTTRINVPGYGLQDLYYQHINLSPGLAVGQIVQQGQQIGTINDQVNELEMGFNANWGGVWGTNHPAQWATDPRPMLAALMTGTAMPNYNSGTVGGINIPNLPSTAQMTNFVQRFGLVFIGGLIILVGITVAFFAGQKQVSDSPEAQEVVKAVAA